MLLHGHLQVKIFAYSLLTLLKAKLLGSHYFFPSNETTPSEITAIVAEPGFYRVK
jgi:hypothetical protein